MSHGIGSITQRNKAISSFTSTQSCVQGESKPTTESLAASRLRVILVSTEHAASGTNLQSATHVIMMEPLVGKLTRVDALEAQAIGRAQRQGRTQPLVVTRIRAIDTIEETLHQQSRHD